MIDKAKQKLTYLKWQDSHSNSGWFSKESLIKVIEKDAWIVEEIGWIVQEDDKEIHLCSRRGCWDKEEKDVDEYGMYQRIPKTWILKRKVIKI